MLAGPPVFPDHLPDGYQFLEEEFSYDPARHLQLEFPQRVWTLEEFGYDQAAIDNCASTIAVTTPFRLLSDEDVKILHRVATPLKGLSASLSGARTPSHLAGGAYHLKFLRDFCACPVILEYISKKAGKYPNH